MTTPTLSDAERLALKLGHGVGVLLDVTDRPGPARVELTLHLHPGGTIDIEVNEKRKFVDPRRQKA